MHVMSQAEKSDAEEKHHDEKAEEQRAVIYV